MDSLTYPAALCGLGSPHNRTHYLEDGSGCSGFRGLGLRGLGV